MDMNYINGITAVQGDVSPLTITTTIGDNVLSVEQLPKKRSATKEQPAVTVERRVFALQDVEIRAKKNDDGSIRMSGYAAVFDSRSVTMWDWVYGSYQETIDPGAFTKTIQEADVRLLINHDANLILARTRPGTLRLSEDDTGLKVQADMAPTSYAQDLAVSMQRGDVSQMSFAFRIIKESWAETEDGLPLRHLEEVALSDTSIVTYPAYPETEAALRAHEWRALLDVFGLAHMDQDERKALLVQLLTHEIEPHPQAGTRPPIAPAAREALATPEAAAEPHAQHSEDETGESYDLLERHHRGLALMHGFTVKETNHVDG